MKLIQYLYQLCIRGINFVYYMIYQITRSVGQAGYLEYPSSEERDLAHVAVRLDLIECGAVFVPVLAGVGCALVLWDMPLAGLGLGLFMQWYSSFGNSPLLNFSINSCGNTEGRNNMLIASKLQM